MGVQVGAVGVGHALALVTLVGLFLVVNVHVIVVGVLVDKSLDGVAEETLEI